MIALLYGLNAGLAFSPHTLSMIFKTVHFGRRSGLLFMASGLAFDAGLILIAWQLHKKLHLSRELSSVLQLFSGAMVIRLALKSRVLKQPDPTHALRVQSSRLVQEGFLIQALNPNPYLFWLLIAVPHFVLAKTQREAFTFVIVFLSVTYGIKLVMIQLSAYATGRLEVFKNEKLGLIKKSLFLLILLNGLYLVFRGAFSFFN